MVTPGAAAADRPERTGRLIACGFCGVEFEEDRGQPACQSCPLAAVTGGCRSIRCPHCGYENPSTPDWVERLASWLR